MMNKLPPCLLVLVWTSAAFALAQDHAPVDVPAHSPANGAANHADGGVHAVTRPVLPEEATWAGIVVIVILVGMFLPAAVIGPIARALAPEDEPETHSHDEPPGASHHHGTSGTHDSHGHGH